MDVEALAANSGRAIDESEISHMLRFLLEVWFRMRGRDLAKRIEEHLSPSITQAAKTTSLRATLSVEASRAPSTSSELGVESELGSSSSTFRLSQHLDVSQQADYDEMFESYEEEVSAPSSVEATDTGSITDGYGVKDHSFEVGAIDEEVGAAAARAENEIFGAVQVAMAVEDPGQ